MQEIKLFNTEEFKLEKAGQGKDQKVILKGNAMPLNETSRNGVYYRPESVKKAYKSLQGVPFLFAHQQNEVRHVLGKVEKVDLTNSHLTYEADIDSEEKEFIRKSEKGYINHVSVGCLINPETVEFDEEKQIAKVDVTEFCELSSAPVPGYKNTSADLGKQNLILIAESLGKEDMVKKLKETEEKPEETPEETSEDTTEDEDEEDKEEKENLKEETIETEEPEAEEKTTEEQLSELSSKVNEIEEKMTEYLNQIAVIESKVDSILDEEEKKDDEDEDEDEDEDDEKKDKDDEDDKKDKDDEEDETIEPPKEEFKTKPEPVQEIKQKEKELKIDKKSTEINIENQIKKNRRY